MKYFLVIGLNYQRYKEPAKVHVSSGDRLLDSFELTDTSLDVFLKQDQMHYEFLQKYKKDLTGLAAPQYYRVYKVDEAEIRDNFSIKFYKLYIFDHFYFVKNHKNISNTFFLVQFLQKNKNLLPN